MASGRMEFHADTIMQHANFSFVLPNDVEMEEVFDQRHYDRPTKTLILLHGLTGTDTDWLFGGVAQEMAIQYNLAVFMPTAGNNFYLDRGYRGGNWGSYVGEELPAYIRKVFGYAESCEDTFIGGLSMGGYGALHTASAGSPWAATARCTRPLPSRRPSPAAWRSPPRCGSTTSRRAATTASCRRRC